MAQQYDSFSKHLIWTYPEPIAKFAFGGQNVEVEEVGATEQITVGHSDIVLKVRFPHGARGILHIEVQTQDSQEPMLYRMAAYHGYLFKEHKRPVHSCVIYLHPNAGRTDPGFYAYELDNYRYVIQYKVIRLIEIDGQAILKAQEPALLPLTPLMQRPDDMDANQWLGECVEATKSADVTPDALRNLLGVLGVFSSLIYESEQIKQHIPGGIMHEFPIIQEFVDEAKAQGIEQGVERGIEQGIERGIERGIEQGIEQGIERGERKGTVESIVTLLGTRFPPNAVQALKPALETIDDLPRLKELLIAASKAENFEAFAESLYE